MLYIYYNNIIIYSSVSREHPFFDFEAGDAHSVNSEDFFEGPLGGLRVGDGSWLDGIRMVDNDA